VKTIVESERAKYAELWSDVPDYRIHSPGLENVDRFMKIMQPSPGDTLIDIGCGTGCAGMEFKKHGLNVNWIDITDAGIDTDIPMTRFINATLWSRWDRDKKHGFDYGFCCDVMEHIPTEYTMLVIDRIMSACRVGWFQIALVPDQFGEVIGKPLHLTVRPYGWWLERLRDISNVVDARDLCEQALFICKR
jgi:2-polyprenyl-3-methyl-5-hydroxy-6-metoxy-1,4-benzoquinol methylase